MSNQDFKLIEGLIHQEYELEEETEKEVNKQMQIFPNFQIVKGKAGFLYRVKNSSNNAKHTILHLISKFDEVWVWTSISGTISGTMFGLDINSVKLDFQAVYRFQFKDKQIFRVSQLRDTFRRLHQIGKVIFEENNEEKVNKYLNQLKQIGLIS